MPETSVKELEGRLARRERELEAIHRITCALYDRAGLEDLVHRALLAAIETVEASAGSILLHEPLKRELVFRYVVGATAEITRQLIGRRMPDDQGLAGAVFQSGRGVITPDVAAEARHYHDIDEAVAYHTQDMI